MIAVSYSIKALTRNHSGANAHALQQYIIFQELFHALSQRIRVAARNQKTRDAIIHPLRNATHPVAIAGVPQASASRTVKSKDDR